MLELTLGLSKLKDSQSYALLKFVQMKASKALSMPIIVPFKETWYVFTKTALFVRQTHRQTELCVCLYVYVSVCVCVCVCVCGCTQECEVWGDDDTWATSTHILMSQLGKHGSELWETNPNPKTPWLTLTLTPKTPWLTLTQRHPD